MPTVGTWIILATFAVSWFAYTDARFYRHRGRVAYGAGLFSPSMDFSTFGSRFHGHDERIDVESLALATDFWVNIATDICG